MAAKLAAAAQAAEDAVEQKLRKRLDDAVRWVDKEIRKLIGEIQKIGGSDDKPVVSYGALFAATQDSMEALSGTLMTAKKRGVVSYEGTLLLQRIHDEVAITLLKHEIPDSPLPDHSKRKAPPAQNSGFQKINTGAPEKCGVCAKTVYASERVGAGGQAFHNTCFRCKHCNKILEPTAFSNVNGNNYCRSCFQTLVNQKGLNF